MFIKGLVNRLSHDYHMDIDRDVLTAYSRSSSCIRVDLPSKTICTTTVVTDVSRTSLMLGGFRSKALLALLEEETVSSAFRCGNYRLLCCRIVSNHASGISISLSVLMLIGWSLVNSPNKSTKVQVRGSVNKLNLVPERKMPSLIGMFRSCRGLSSLKPYIPIVLLKRKCPLISSRIENSWHMMKKSEFLIFRPEIPYGGLRNEKYFFEHHKKHEKLT